MKWLKRRLRQLGWLLGIIAILVALFIGVEHVRGHQALKARLGELKAKGEQFAVAALEPHRSSGERNAALALLALTNDLSRLQSNLLVLPPTGRFTAPGRVMTVWQFQEWSENKKTNDWPHLTQTMQRSQDVLQSIHAALQRPEWDGGFDYQKGFCDFRYQPIAHLRVASRILSAALACDLRQGRTNEAVEMLTDAVRLVRAQKDERLILSQLVRLTCATVAWNSTWEMLQTNVASERQLAGLQAAWREIDFGTDMARAMEMERAMALEAFIFTARFGAGKNSQIDLMEKSEALLGDQFSFLPTHGVLLHWIHLPLWRVAWAEQDARRGLDRWQEVVETERITRTNSWVAAKDMARLVDAAAAESPWLEAGIEDAAPKQSLYDRWRYLLSNQATGFKATIVRKVVEAETARRMMVTALALKRYLLRHGQPAVSLDALVPELLSALPIDGMDGKPLRYRLNPDGTFLLYSVGEDGEDNGGDSRLVKGKTTFTKIWDGQDAIWPTVALPEEAAKAAWRK